MAIRLDVVRRQEQLFLLNNERGDENPWPGDCSLVTCLMLEI